MKFNPALLDRIVDVVLSYKPKKKKKKSQKRPRIKRTGRLAKPALLCALAISSCPMQGPWLIPRQTPNQSSKEIQKDSDGKNAPTGLPLSTSKQIQTHGEQNNCCAIAEKDKDRTVKVTNSSEISVHSIKDKSDYVLMGCTALLVLFGGWQLWVLSQTVKTTVNSERAWMIRKPLKYSPFRRNAKESDFVPKVEITFQNHGHTPAFIIKYAFRLCLLAKTEYEQPLDYGRVATLGDGEAIGAGKDSIPYFAEWEKNRHFNDEELDSIESRESVFALYGYIIYKTIFSSKTIFRGRDKPLGRTEFCFRYLYKRGDILSSAWQYEERPGVNRHL